VAKQMSLAFSGCRNLAVAVSWRAVERETRRRLATYGRRGSRLSLELGGLAAEAALLDQVRRKARAAARRPDGRKNAQGFVAYVCTSEGHKVHAVIDRLSERLASREAALCG